MMKKKNGFIAISVIYSFFLCFVLLMMGLLANYSHARLILRKTNLPLVFEQDNRLLTKIKENLPGDAINDFTLPAGNNTSGLYETSVDDKTSYYFRGNVENNYVKLSDTSSFVWRIVRINEDNTIRLILNSSISSGSYNHNEGGEIMAAYDSSTIKEILDNWYNNNLGSFNRIIKSNGNFCNNMNLNSLTGNFAGYENISMGVPSLACSSPFASKIGLLNAEEANFAGLALEGSASNNYLSFSSSYWTMTPSSNDGTVKVFVVSTNNRLEESSLTATNAIRPVINLIQNVKIISGSGTSSDPYIIDS